MAAKKGYVWTGGEWVSIGSDFIDSSQFVTQSTTQSISGAKTFTENVTISKTAPLLNISAANANHASIVMQINGSNRWIIRTDSITESGSNAGSNLDIVRRSDAGALLGTPLSINRATGLTTMESLSVTGAITTPTPAANTDTTQVATTAYVKTAISNMFKASGVASTSLSWNSLTTPGPSNVLWHGTDNANGPANTYYYYVVVFEYNGTNLTQVAYQYSDGGKIAIRSRYSGTWSTWVVLS